MNRLASFCIVIYQTEAQCAVARHDLISGSDRADSLLSNGGFENRLNIGQFVKRFKNVTFSQKNGCSPLGYCPVFTP